MSPERLDTIRARAIAAKGYEHDSSTGNIFACPLCSNGDVDGKLYDHKEYPATIIACGLGEGLKLAEDWVENGPDDMLDLVDEVIRLQALLEAK